MRYVQMTVEMKESTGRIRPPRKYIGLFEQTPERQTMVEEVRT